MFKPSVKYQSSTPVRTSIAAASIISLVVGTAAAIPNAEAQTAPSTDPAVATTTTSTAPSATAPQSGQETTRVTEHTGPVPHKVTMEIDTNLRAGKTKVETPGRLGEKTVTVTETIVDGKVIDTKFDETVTVEPVTEVIKVGTKPATATTTFDGIMPLPFTTWYRPNPDLKPGETKLVQKGWHGKQYFSVKSLGTDEEWVDATTMYWPKSQIIEYGPALSEKRVIRKAAHTNGFAIDFQADPSLPLGEQVLERQGEVGEKINTDSWEVKDGEDVNYESRDNVLKEPVNAIVRVGTNPDLTPTETSPAPAGFDSSDIDLTSRVRYFMSQLRSDRARGGIDWLMLPIALLSFVRGKPVEPFMG